MKKSSNLNIIKSSFHPIERLEEKNNYKIYYLIEKDGSIIERVMMDIPDMSERERLICFHFLKNQVLVFYQREIAFNIISRDNPWDFKIELSTNEIFNIEITSIEENKVLFEKIKREERLKLVSNKKEITFYELIKLNNFFPSENIENLIKKYNKRNMSKNELVKNPFYHSQFLFLSGGCYANNELVNIIKNAIQKKEKKNHKEKENTILIIDNRTITYGYDDLEIAIKELDQFLKKSSFKEIWFYTGYYTDYDGNNAEFSLVPLKINSAKKEIIEQSLKKFPKGKNGITYI